MRPRGRFRGALTGMLMGIGIAAMTMSPAGWNVPSSIAAEAVTPATLDLAVLNPYFEYSGLQKDLYFSRSVRPLNRLTVQ